MEAEIAKTTPDSEKPKSQQSWAGSDRSRRLRPLISHFILEGFTGAGKSHLARALGKQACRRGSKTLYVRMPDMLTYRSEKMDAGWPEEKILGKYAAHKVLIMDERLIDKPAKEQMHFLLEVTERCCDNSSTICCPQYGIENWHRRMGGGARAEPVSDHIAHNAACIEVGNVSMREHAASKKS
ncbi:ATP-binding protein [Adlercreutzia sp. ZJ242]|uniref:ATP-binding protein n=1 Tax=Adlercreutzia sp. ZJ242 TaxID=2709409 RepID=UPI0013EE272D|nr:ATP-binding protein [Adlercreutzia sp. ZJ242]